MGVQLPKAFASHGGNFLPRALAVVLDVDWANAALGFSNSPGEELYLETHETVHFWQIACTNFGLNTTEIELIDQNLALMHMGNLGKRDGRIGLPVNPPDRASYNPRGALFFERTKSWDGYDVSVDPVGQIAKNTLVNGTETELPIWYLPLEDSNDHLLRLPIGTRTLFESAAEVIGRAALPRNMAIERQVTLMPYSFKSFPQSSNYWHYSAAHVYFASAVSDHPLSVKERDGMFLDVVDLALLTPGINGDAHVIGPGHRFVQLANAADRVLSSTPNSLPEKLARDIFEEAGYGDHRALCDEILERKRPVIDQFAGTARSPLGPIWGQLYSYFEQAMKLRAEDPTSFGRKLLTRQGVAQMFSILPPPVIFYRDNWWTSPKSWMNPDEQTALSSGWGSDPALSNVFLSSIVDQACSQDYVQCPLRDLGIGTPCGCEVERAGIQPLIPPPQKQDVGHCHFLSIWRQIETQGR